jgi:hypothetical protein
MNLRISRGIIAFVIAVLLSTGAQADTVKLRAALDASQEVPPTDSKGKGVADLTYDTTSKVLTWTITYDGLTGSVVAAHFHGPADAGKNAGVVVPIGQGALASPLAGKATLTDEQATELLAGRWYVNLHTAANKAGEIRGQVTK